MEQLICALVYVFSVPPEMSLIVSLCTQTGLFHFITEDAKIGKEIKTLFNHNRSVEVEPDLPSGSRGNESIIARADKLCKQLKRPNKRNARRRDCYKPYKRVSTPSKEVQKGLVVIDFQGSNPTGVLPLREYEKIFDGCIRFDTDMTENDIRDEIVRLVRQKKETITHDFSCMVQSDFDFGSA